jgi:hypothetical protein
MEHSPTQSQNFTRFGKLLAALARNKVDFAVVGGLSMIFNGYGRVTLDAAILVDNSPSNIEKLLEVLRHWGEGWARELTPGDFKPEEGAVRVMEEFDLDIFTQMRGKTLAYFRPRLRELKLADAALH